VKLGLGWSHTPLEGVSIPNTMRLSSGRCLLWQDGRLPFLVFVTFLAAYVLHCFPAAALTLSHGSQSPTLRRRGGTLSQLCVATGAPNPAKGGLSITPTAWR